MSEIYKVLFCGHCHRESPMLMSKVNVVARRTFQDAAGSTQTASGIPKDRDRAAFTGLCALCGRATFVDARVQTDPETQKATMVEVEQYPPPHSTLAPAVWPETLRTAWTDVIKVQGAGASAPTLATSVGTCLQHALRLLDAKGKNLADEIDDLRDKNIITGALAAWAHDLRDQRNNGTHDFAGDPEDAAEAVVFLRMFLHLTFTLRLEIKERRAARGG